MKMDMPAEIIAKVVSYLPKEDITYILYEFSFEKLSKEEDGGILLRWHFALEIYKNSSIYIDRHEVNIIKELDAWGEPVDTYLTNTQEKWTVKELGDKEIINKCGLCVQKGDDYERIIPFSCLSQLVDLVFLIDRCKQKYDNKAVPNNVYNWVINEIKGRLPDVRVEIEPTK